MKLLSCAIITFMLVTFSFGGGFLHRKTTKKGENQECDPTKTRLDLKKASKQVDKIFEDQVIPGLEDFIRIKNLSPDYDPTYYTNGLAEQAAQHIIDWVQNMEIKGLSYELFDDENRSPLLFFDINPSQNKSDETLLFYGHFDK